MGTAARRFALTSRHTTRLGLQPANDSEVYDKTIRSTPCHIISSIYVFVLRIMVAFFQSVLVVVVLVAILTVVVVVVAAADIVEVAEEGGRVTSVVGC